MLRMFLILPSAGALLLSSGAIAQTASHATHTTATIAAMPHDESSYQEKINAQVQALMQQVSQLQKRVAV